MKSLSVLFLIVPVLTLSSCTKDVETTEPAAEAFLEWMKENAVTISTTEPGTDFADLEVIKSIVGDARLVCLGESRHDIHEQHQFKHRLIEFLVEEMGFTVFAMEEGLPHSRKIDEYILSGEGDPEKLLNGMAHWMIWDTAEVLALVKWMREHNEGLDDKSKIRFYGCDMTYPSPSIENVIAYLDKIDPQYAASMQARPLGLEVFSDVFLAETVKRYAGLSAEQKFALQNNLSELVSHLKTRRDEYIDHSSEYEFEWALRQALVAQQANDNYRAWVDVGWKEAMLIRDKAMADNIRWIMDYEAPDKRIIVWAHNGHVARGEVATNIPNRPRTGPMAMMGAHLSETFGDRMVVFSFSYNTGVFRDTTMGPADANTVDGMLAQCGLPMFLLDIRRARNTPASQWLTEKRKMRAEGGYVESAPGRTCDVLVFFDKVTSTVRNPLAEKRFEALPPDLFTTVFDEE
ncbi:MAG: erythromycin esterase family protein [Desulfobacteria bacterium]